MHADPSDMTMSMMREKQYEACERRLFSHPRTALFAPEATELDAQALFENSFDFTPGRERLCTLDELRAAVLVRMPLEAAYVGAGERQLLEKLFLNDGRLLLSDWDDLGAAEALLSRLWCSFCAEGDDWYLLLPEALQAPLLAALGAPEAHAAGERAYRFDATIHGLLYLAGLLHAAQATEFFLNGVMQRQDDLAREIARRYLQASFEYVMDGAGEMILLHPGLADPYQLVRRQKIGAMDAFEMTPEMVAGGMNGLLPEEAPLHEALCAALQGALRPELDANDTAEDLRMLAKQNVSLAEMESVLAASVTVLPTREMLEATRRLYEGVPRWLGLKAALEH